MRELINEMNEYYDKIKNQKKEEEIDNLDEEEENDEDENEEKKDKAKFNIIFNYSQCIEEFISLFDQKDFKNEEILVKVKLLKNSKLN